MTIYGCGGVGLFAVQGARIASASQVIAVDPLESKRNAAAAAGATDLIDPTEGDPVEQVRALTSGRGTDYAFEIVGKPSTMVQAYHSARPRGVAVIVGMPATDAALTLPAADLFRSERRIVGSFYGSAQVMRDMPILVGLAETGALDIESVVSRRIGLDEIGDALRALDNGDALRSVIVPGI